MVEVKHLVFGSVVCIALLLGILIAITVRKGDVGSSADNVVFRNESCGDSVNCIDGMNGSSVVVSADVAEIDVGFDEAGVYRTWYRLRNGSEYTVYG